MSLGNFYTLVLEPVSISSPLSCYIECTMYVDRENKRQQDEVRQREDQHPS